MYALGCKGYLWGHADELAALLMQYGADPSAKNKKGESVIDIALTHYIVERGGLEHLLSCGMAFPEDIGVRIAALYEGVMPNGNMYAVLRGDGETALVLPS